MISLPNLAHASFQKILFLSISDACLVQYRLSSINQPLNSINLLGDTCLSIVTTNFYHSILRSFSNLNPLFLTHSFFQLNFEIPYLHSMEIEWLFYFPINAMWFFEINNSITNRRVESV